MIDSLTDLNIAYSTIEPSQLEHIIGPRYSMLSKAKYVYFARGSSDLYKIYTKNRNYFARITTANSRPKAHIDSEIQFLEYCDKNGVPVSKPVSDREGKMTLSLKYPEGDRYLNLFEEVSGTHVASPNSWQLKSIGHLLGSFHRKANRFIPDPEFPIYDLRECLTHSYQKINAFIRSREELRQHSISFYSLLK